MFGEKSNKAQAVEVEYTTPIILAQIMRETYWKTFWTTFRDYLSHPESKFDGNTGILKRKHVVFTNVIHIGKESNNLDETEFLGVDSESYEIYEDKENLDLKFKKIASRILKLQPRDVKKFGISKQTLWNVSRK